MLLHIIYLLGLEERKTLMALLLPPTRSVWALDETATGAIAFSKRLLQAATSDHVSPLALMVCESFGSLLPSLSRDTPEG
jgi:hypothetical protein